MSERATRLLDRANGEKESTTVAENLISISMVYPMMKALTKLGFETEPFFRYASFDTALLGDPEARIGGEELERLMEAAAAYAGDPFFGLRQGQLTDVSDLGVLGYVMMHSSVIVEALSAYRRYNEILCSGFTLEWETRDGETTLAFAAGEKRLARHCAEDMAVSVYRLMSGMSHRTIPLTDVSFAHDAPPEGTGPYVSAFGRLPRFGAEINALRFPADALHYPILYADPKLRGVFEEIAARTKEKLARGQSFTDDVFRRMVDCMPAYFPTLRQTSALFHMSARSLQLKLQEEGTSYNEVAATVRRELAERYLREPANSVGDVAYLLHYSEPSAFQSAFKKWTGMTPGQFRAKRHG
ncbi:AraC family transcriptional regulator [Paenibacillus sp. TRM 82003]|nr:AraC family transcriptional regulator [Paenibacillus sp. TRM 82003]